MRTPNPAIRLPQWRWLERFDRWRCERGILTGRWTQAEIDDQKRRADELSRALRRHMDPPDCCGHAWGAHECGVCQVVLNNGWDGQPVRFCPCPANDRYLEDDD